MSLKVVDNPWYKKGLRFKCTQCGRCCSGKEGYVFLSENDIQDLCKYFDLSEKEFLEKYTRLAYGKIALKDLNQKGDCIFLKDNKCTVYESRPTQCKTFPWWPAILDTKDSWENCKELCEGVDHPDGRKISFDEIQNYLKKNFAQDESD